VNQDHRDNVLHDTVFVDFKVFFFQIGHELTARITRDDVRRDEIDGNPKVGRLLAGCLWRRRLTAAKHGAKANNRKDGQYVLVFHGVKYTTSLGQGGPSLVELISWLRKAIPDLRRCRFGSRFCDLIAGSPTPSASPATGAPAALDAKGAPNLPQPRVEMLQSVGNLGLCYPDIRIEHFHRAAHFFEPCWIVPDPFVNPCGYFGIPRANAAEEFRTQSSLDRGGSGRLVRGRRDQHVGATVIDRDWHKGGRLDFGYLCNIGRDGLGRRKLARRGCL
jgi:hypothetical protein